MITPVLSNRKIRMTKNHHLNFWLISCLWAAGILLAGPSVAPADDLSVESAQVYARAEELYREGIDLFKTRRYEQAREKFQDVEQVKSNYKSTDAYLKRSAELVDYNNRVALENERKEWEQQKLEYERDLKMQKRLMAEQTQKLVSKDSSGEEGEVLSPKELDRLKKEKQKVEKAAQARAAREEKTRARDEKRIANLQAVQAERDRKAAIKEEKRRAKLQKKEEAQRKKKGSQNCSKRRR